MHRDSGPLNARDKNFLNMVEELVSRSVRYRSRRLVTKIRQMVGMLQTAGVLRFAERRIVAAANAAELLSFQNLKHQEVSGRRWLSLDPAPLSS
jgi:hypothetical protein